MSAPVNEKGLHGPESVLNARPGEPTVQSVRTIVLRYGWSTLPEAVSATTPLCLKQLEAWVFSVPDAPYTVLISDAVPRFGHGQ